MYHIVAERKVEKQLRALSPDIFESVVAAIQALADNPRPPGCLKLRGTKRGWRIVVRKHYRVLYTVDDAAREVRVFRVSRRGKATYRR